MSSEPFDFTQIYAAAPGLQDVNGMSVPDALCWYNRYGYAAEPARDKTKMLIRPKGYSFDDLGVLGEPELAQVAEAGRQFPDSPLRAALILGEASGLVAIDVDNLDEWAKFREAHQDLLLPTAWQTTGRPGGGFHLVFRRGGADPRLLKSGSWPGLGSIELKCKGLIIAAPSLYSPGGPRYQWQEGPGEPVPIPAGLLEGFRKGREQQKARTKVIIQEVNKAGRRDMPADNVADFTDDLCDQLGAGIFTGIYQRDNRLVTVPRVGETGYVPVKDSDKHPEHNPPAQVRTLDQRLLQAFVTGRAWTYQTVKTGDGPDDFVKVHVLPSLAACGAAVSSDPSRWASVPPLAGVTHVPVLRRDGTLLQAPGYDESTGLLYLPLPHQPQIGVPEQPSAADSQAAAGRLWTLFRQFGWVSTADYLNYLAAVLIPVLRLVIPPPWPPWFINAHERGSGKTLLCDVARILHGGVLFTAPEDNDEELRKLLFSILSTTTGSVVVFDNAMQAVRSRHLASLFTSPDGMLHDRRLGVSESPGVPNDRAWMINGNNLRAGGDLPRRALWASIDPGVPRPWMRTEFEIPSLAGHVTANRAGILADLLTIGRHWALAGFPPGSAIRGDSFARFASAVSGLLTSAGLDGSLFWSDETSRSEDGEDDEDWADFLPAVFTWQGDLRWKASEVISATTNGNAAALRAKLPGDLGHRLARGDDPENVAKSLGWWLANHEGQWTSERYRVLRVSGGGKSKRTRRYRVEHRS